MSQDVAAVVTGSLSRRGDGYKLSVEAMDAVTGKTIAEAEVTAPEQGRSVAGDTQTGGPYPQSARRHYA